MLHNERCNIRQALRISSGFLKLPQLILPRVHKAIRPLGSSNLLNGLVGNSISQHRLL